jgi:hypothetical protein
MHGSVQQPSQTEDLGRNEQQYESPNEQEDATEL